MCVCVCVMCCWGGGGGDGVCVYEWLHQTGVLLEAWCWAGLPGTAVVQTATSSEGCIVYYTLLLVKPFKLVPARQILFHRPMSRPSCHAAFHKGPLPAVFALDKLDTGGLLQRMTSDPPLEPAARQSSCRQAQQSRWL